MSNVDEYDFETGNWQRCIGERSGKQICQDFVDPVRRFDIRVDSCQSFNRDAGKTTWMYAVVLRSYDDTTDPDWIDASYPLATDEFAEKNEAFAYAYALMHQVDAGEFDDEIMDPLAKGRAKQLSRATA